MQQPPDLAPLHDRAEIEKPLPGWAVWECYGCRTQPYQVWRFAQGRWRLWTFATTIRGALAASRKLEAATEVKVYDS